MAEMAHRAQTRKKKSGRTRVKPGIIRRMFSVNQAINNQLIMQLPSENTLFSHQQILICGDCLSASDRVIAV
jgi:hypothetical protein